MGVRGVLVYCHCGHHTALDADRWADEVRLSDLEPLRVSGLRKPWRRCFGPDRGDPRLAIIGMKETAN